MTVDASQNEAGPDRPTGPGRRGMLGMAAFGTGGAALIGSARAATPSLPRKAFRFVLVAHTTLEQFFAPTIYGIQDACAEFGYSYQWTGSHNNVVSEMVEAMETAIAEKADGIAVCLVEPTAFDAVTAKASAAGIPVIAFDADVPAGSPNKRLANVGQPMFQAGYNVAQNG